MDTCGKPALGAGMQGIEDRQNETAAFRVEGPNDAAVEADGQVDSQANKDRLSFLPTFVDPAAPASQGSHINRSVCLSVCLLDAAPVTPGGLHAGFAWPPSCVSDVPAACGPADGRQELSCTRP
jgi:hypothetical protein